MKKYLVLCCLFISSFYSHGCHASYCQSESDDVCCCSSEIKDQALYVGLMGGLNLFQTKAQGFDYDPGYYVGAKIGYKFANHIKTEAEVTYQRTGIDQMRRFTTTSFCGHVRAWSYMANLLYQFDINCPAKPYLGFGLGYAQTKIHYSGTYFGFLDIIQFSGKGRNDGLAYQAIAGIGFPITQKVEASIEYRFFSLNNDIFNQRIGIALTRLF